MKMGKTFTFVAAAGVVVALAAFVGSAQADPIEPYRLAFITSTDTGTVGSDGEIMTDIAHYNAHVQALADAAGIGDTSTLLPNGVRWYVIGSTADVDARDNTGTNPDISDGVPVYNLVDDTLIALNNKDLWDGEVVNTINYDETGALKSHWPFTGTGPDGTQATANFGPLGQIGGDVAQGQSSVTTNWIHRSWTGDPPTTGLPMYAMSEIIPEPATMSLLVLGGLAMLRRRRRA